MSFINSNINIGSDNSLLSVEIEFITDDEFNLRVLSVKEKKGSVDFKELYNDTGTWDKLKELTEGKVVILLLTGKGILTKKILPKTEEIQLEDILPNSSKSDFYYQAYPVANIYFGCVSRKQKADEVMVLLKNNKTIVVEIYLGLGICSMASHLVEQEEINTPSHHFIFREGILVEIQSAKNEDTMYAVDKKEISASMIPILCSAVYFYTRQVYTSSIDSDDYQYFKIEYKQRSLFQKAGSLVLISLLFILFGNYLAYNHYSERYQLLEEEVAYKQSEIDLLNTLKNELEQKQLMIGGTGMNSGYRLSMISDRIGQTIPSTVKLTEMNFQPLEKGKLKKNEKANFSTDKIVVKGKIFKSTDINDWIREIRNDAIIKDVVVTNYSQSLNENFAEFELMIDLN